MRNLSSRSSTVRPLAAALLLSAALVATEGTAAPAAHAAPRTVISAQQATRIRASRRLLVRASRSGNRMRPSVARAVRVPIPLTDPVWAELRRCESGGRYDINTGNGFYGAYQFVPSTWRAMGYPGMPHQAPPGIQDAAAQQLQSRSGWGQWPACSRKLGLR